MQNILLSSFTRFTGFVLLIYFLHSCVPSYIPNTVNTPLFNGKRQLTANIGTGISGYDPQVAFSVTDHLGVMINSSFANRTSDSTDNFHKHAFIEGGVGYFISPEKMLVLEAYGGFGAGKVESYYENGLWTGKADANLRRFFFQPAVGFTSKVFDASFSPRLVFVDVDVIDRDVSSIYHTGFRPYIEPTFTFKVGYKYVKFFMQFGCSVSFDSKDKYVYDSQPFLFSLGLQCTLGKKYF
jgi:hypothetical protein